MYVSSRRSHKSIFDQHPPPFPIIRTRLLQPTTCNKMNANLLGPAISKSSVFRPFDIRLWASIHIFDGVSRQLRRIWRFIPNIRSLWNYVWQGERAREYERECPLSKKCTTLKQGPTSLSHHSKQQQAPQRKMKSFEVSRKRREEYKKSNEVFQRVLQPRVFRQRPAFQFHSAVSEITIEIEKSRSHREENWRAF